MSFPRRKLFWPLAIAACLFLSTAVAQVSNGVPPVPPLPQMKSPVDFFRDLLAMTPMERKKFLAARTEENQKRIQEKLHEYESLTADERELRLRATELRWYLLPLMSTSGADRAARLALIPADMRKLVEERLTRWDILPPPLQQEFLNDELVKRYFTSAESMTKEQQEKILSQISPEQRKKLEAGLAQWQKLSEEDRQKKLDGFNQFFELTSREKKKALNTLSEAERRQMEKTLNAYENLPKEQRIACIRSFEKFADLSVEERQQFLKNAARWQEMTPNQRQSWRALVAKLQKYPPLPPGFGGPPLPPMPRSGLQKGVVATN